MKVYATQVGPERWAGRVEVNGVCVYSAAHKGEEAALADASREAGIRQRAMDEAAKIARLQDVRRQALPIVLELAKRPDPARLAEIVDRAAALAGDIELQAAAE